MLFKIDKSEQERITGSMNITQGELVTLSFSEEGKEPWTSFKMSGRVLHKILCDTQAMRENIHDPELEFRRLNGHSFLVGPPEETKEE